MINMILEYSYVPDVPEFKCDRLAEDVMEIE